MDVPLAWSLVNTFFCVLSIPAGNMGQFICLYCVILNSPSGCSEWFISYGLAAMLKGLGPQLPENFRKLS